MPRRKRIPAALLISEVIMDSNNFQHTLSGLLCWLKSGEDVIETELTVSTPYFNPATIKSDRLLSHIMNSRTSTGRVAKETDGYRLAIVTKTVTEPYPKKQWSILTYPGQHRSFGVCPMPLGPMTIHRDGLRCRRGGTKESSQALDAI